MWCSPFKCRNYYTTSLRSDFLLGSWAWVALDPKREPAHRLLLIQHSQCTKLNSTIFSFWFLRYPISFFLGPMGIPISFISSSPHSSLDKQNRSTPFNCLKLTLAKLQNWWLQRAIAVCSLQAKNHWLIHGCHRHQFSKFPDYSLTFPW